MGFGGGLRAVKIVNENCLACLTKKNLKKVCKKFGHVIGKQ